MALDVKNDITKYDLKEGQFFAEEHPKNQLYLHHTASGPDGKTVIDGWNMNIDKIGTPFVICGKPKDGETKYKDGEIIQCFSSRHYAYHLGIPAETFKKYNIPYQRLDKTSVGVELANWGYLTKQKDGTFKNYVGGTVPIDQVVDLGSEYRGYQFYHKYSDAQINSLKNLLIYLCDKYNIPKKYNEEMFKVNQSALNGQSGIFSHTSVRQDKFDASPQIRLINMLKTLEDKPSDIDTPLNSPTT